MTTIGSGTRSRRAVKATSRSLRRRRHRRQVPADRILDPPRRNCRAWHRYRQVLRRSNQGFGGARIACRRGAA